jgi:hypothetical protein
MAAATSVVARQGNDQFRGIYDNTWEVTCVLDASNLADGAGETNTIAVPGVILGDMVISFSSSVDLAGITVSPYVSAAGVVSLRYQNESGGAVDLASATIRVIVGRMVD